MGDTSVKKSTSKQKVSKIRIRIQAYEYAVLDEAVRQIHDTCTRLGADVVGPIPLPTKIKKYTTNRATFVFKDSREQFEMRIHRRFLDVFKPSQRIVEALSNLTIPSSVSTKIQIS